MTFDQIMELVGYLASLLVLVSLLMTSVVKLRIINSLGALIYVVYAFTIKSYPTAIMNLFLILINFWQLMRVNRTTVNYDLRELASNEAGLEIFLKYYGEDIHKYFPDFHFEKRADQYICMVFAEADPVGLMIGVTDGDTMHMKLDYSTPRYRDCTVGKYLYARLRDKGVKTLRMTADTDSHSAYLKRMGFHKDEQGYFKNL